MSLNDKKRCKIEEQQGLKERKQKEKTTKGCVNQQKTLPLQPDFGDLIEDNPQNKKTKQ
jgi:hypothetical protein